MLNHHSPQVLLLDTCHGTMYQGACSCCGWASEKLVFEETEALSLAYDHLAGCDECWKAA